MRQLLKCWQFAIWVFWLQDVQSFHDEFLLFNLFENLPNKKSTGEPFAPCFIWGPGTPGVGTPPREPQRHSFNQVGTLQVSSPPWITWNVSVASATSFDGIGWIFFVYKRWKWTARPWRKVDSILGETHYWDQKRGWWQVQKFQGISPPFGCIKKPL